MKIPHIKHAIISVKLGDHMVIKNKESNDSIFFTLIFARNVILCCTLWQCKHFILKILKVFSYLIFNRVIPLNLYSKQISRNFFLPSGSRSLVTPYSFSMMWNMVSIRSRTCRRSTFFQSIRSGLHVIKVIYDKFLVNTI